MSWPLLRREGCTINEGDPYVAVAQSVYLARHLGCAYTRVCDFPRSQNLCGVAGSSNFRRRPPVAREK